MESQQYDLIDSNSSVNAMNTYIPSLEKLWVLLT